MTFMGQIAGGGVAAQPYLVERVESGGEVTYQAKTTYTDRVMSQNLASQMKNYLRNNVEVTYGTWKFPGLTVCGKSGTAELGKDHISNAMFAGFVADEKYPLAFICVVENGGYGAATCVPILSTVLSECKAVLDAELKQIVFLRWVERTLVGRICRERPMCRSAPFIAHCVKWYNILPMQIDPTPIPFNQTG